MSSSTVRVDMSGKVREEGQGSVEISDGKA